MRIALSSIIINNSPCLGDFSYLIPQSPFTKVRVLKRDEVPLTKPFPLSLSEGEGDTGSEGVIIIIR